MHHRTMCLTYHTMFGELPLLSKFEKYLTTAFFIPDPCSAASQSSLCRLTTLSRPTGTLLGTLIRRIVPDDQKKNAHRQSLLFSGVRRAQSYGAALRVRIFLLGAKMSIITLPQTKEAAKLSVDNSLTNDVPPSAAPHSACIDSNERSPTASQRNHTRNLSAKYA